MSFFGKTLEALLKPYERIDSKGTPKDTSVVAASPINPTPAINAPQPEVQPRVWGYGTFKK